MKEEEKQSAAADADGELLRVFLLFAMMVVFCSLVGLWSNNTYFLSTTTAHFPAITKATDSENNTSLYSKANM
jgi:hypothetical protein